MNKIYDCFPFFNELDILEIRLELLYDIVDFFVISECDYTFSGLKKPYYFEENKFKYKKYLDKIIHIKHTNTFEYKNLTNTYVGQEKKLYERIINHLYKNSNTAEFGFGAPHWCRDYLHKELTMMGMLNCQDDDLILFGDCDEIPSPQCILEITKMHFLDETKFTLKQKNMIYYVNNENLSEDWYGQIVTLYKNIKDSSCMVNRNMRLSYQLMEHGGWHLTFMGGYDRIVKKIKSWSHQEYNNIDIINSVNNMLIDEKDVLHRRIRFKKHDLESLYPPKIIDLIKEKYNYLIK